MAIMLSKVICPYKHVSDAPPTETIPITRLLSYGNYCPVLTNK